MVLRTAGRELSAITLPTENQMRTRGLLSWESVPIDRIVYRAGPMAKHASRNVWMLSLYGDPRFNSLASALRMEGWSSGLRQRSASPLGGKTSRGFESLSFLQL